MIPRLVVLVHYWLVVDGRTDRQTQNIPR